MNDSRRSASGEPALIAIASNARNESINNREDVAHHADVGAVAVDDGRPGTLDEWREWTGLPFDRTGPVVVPRALVPVHCNVEHGVAAYIEPNVWIVHRTSG